MITASIQTKTEIAALVLVLEGVISDDPRDRGGLTKWGISSRYHPTAASNDFTIVDAFKIYEDYISSSKTTNIIAVTGNRPLAYLHFQFAFNIGPQRAMSVLQLCCNTASLSTGSAYDTGNSLLEVDGVWGPKTQAAVARANSETDLFDSLRQAQAGWYMAHGHATNQKYFVGTWLKRIGQNFDRAMRMLDEGSTLIGGLHRDSRKTILDHYKLSEETTDAQIVDQLTDGAENELVEALERVQTTGFNRIIEIFLREANSLNAYVSELKKEV